MKLLLPLSLLISGPVTSALRTSDCIGYFPEWDESQCTTVEHRRFMVRHYEIATHSTQGGARCPHEAGEPQEGAECTERLGVEMYINEDTPVDADGEFDFSGLVNKIAAQLGSDPSTITIAEGRTQPTGNRSPTRHLITATIQVLPSEASEEVSKLDCAAFTAATGAIFKRLKPDRNSLICTTCKWVAGGNHLQVGVRRLLDRSLGPRNRRFIEPTKGLSATAKDYDKWIEVVHYRNVQEQGEKGLQHKCYHAHGKCRCLCDNTAKTSIGEGAQAHGFPGFGHVNNLRTGETTLNGAVDPRLWPYEQIATSGFVLEVDFVLAETLGSFDSSKQASFKVAVAQVAGVDASAVTLKIGALSRRLIFASGLSVEAIISMDANDLDTVIDLVTKNLAASGAADAVANAAGIEVKSLAHPVLDKIEAENPTQNRGANTHEAEVVCGRKGKCSNEQAGLKPVSELHEVRCCRGSAAPGWRKNRGCAVWGESDLPTCHHNKNFEGAEAICMAAGARLCTPTELEDGCTAGSGCGHDLDLIWSSREMRISSNNIPPV